MAVDRAGLSTLGYLLGGVTAAVMTMACAVVFQHVAGRVAFDPPPAKIVTPPVVTVFMR
jgi:hypothetical protein